LIRNITPAPLDLPSAVLRSTVERDEFWRTARVTRSEPNFAARPPGRQWLRNRAGSYRGLHYPLRRLVVGLLTRLVAPRKNLLLDPLVHGQKSAGEVGGWLPPKHLTAKAVVRVAATDAHGAIDVLDVDLLARDLRNDSHELVDGDHLFAAEIERLVEVATHQANDAFYTVIDVAEGAGLRSVAPHLDGPARSDFRNLSADRRGRLFAPTLPGSERALDVVKADDPRLYPVVFAVVCAEPLGDQLLPAVGILRLRRIGI
jgi:hypothetical protein